MKRVLFCHAVFAATVPFTSSAAPPPDAGQLLNEQQRANPLPPPRVDPPVLRPGDAPAAAPVAAGLQVQLRSVRFSGATGLASDEALQAQVQGSLGRTLGHAELQRLADDLTLWLRSRGFLLARAYLPRQDLTAGDLEIVLLDGRLQSGPGRVVVRSDARIPAERLAAIADAALPEGPLRRDELERAVLLINDLPGVSARAALERGDTSGTSKLVIEAHEESTGSGGASLDDYSSRSTGRARLGGHLEWNDPLRIGDALGLLAYATTGTTTFGMFYSVPLTPGGWRLNAAASTLHYRVGGDLKPLDLQGSAGTAVLGADYALLRTRERNAVLQLAYEHRTLRDDGNGANLRHRWLDNVTVTIRGNRFDALGGSGGTEGSVALTAGRVDLSGNDADRRLDAASARTDGSFAKATVHVSRIQSLGEAGAAWSVFAALDGQFATGNLDTSEKFILGGPRGVRAYALGEAAGDDGVLATLELRRGLDFVAAGRSFGFLFIDSGRVRLHQTRWTGSVNNAGDTNQYGLTGIGAGIDIAAAGAWSVRAAVAHTVGGNSGRAPNGADVEGRSKRNRVWLQGAVAF